MSTLHALAAAATSQLRSRVGSFSLHLSVLWRKNTYLFLAVHHACHAAEDPHLFFSAAFSGRFSLAFML
jgi:hypothetical protein